MSIYDIDYTQQTNNLVNPGKRKPKILAILNALVYPIQWLRDNFFNEYVMGSAATTYNSGSTYSKLDKVIGKDKAVYQALQAAPIAVDPTSNPDYWQRISDNFIGTDQRVKFNSSLMIMQGDRWSTDGLTYLGANQNGALNKWFEVTSSPWIYITNNTVDSNGFYLGWDGNSSSGMPKSSTYQIDYLGNSYSVTGQNDFTINVPSAVFSQINGDTLTAEAIIRAFVDPIILVGLKYNIITY